MVFIFRKVAEVVPAESFGLWKQGRKPEYFVECHGGRGQSALALRQKAAAPVDHAHAQAAGIGMGIHKLHRLFKRVFLHEGIGVEQQDVAPARLQNGHIVGFAKAEVYLVGNQLYSRKLCSDHGHRAIYTVVVNNKNFAIQVFGSAHHAVEALFEKVLHIVIDNDHRKINHPCRALS